MSDISLGVKITGDAGSLERALTDSQKKLADFAGKMNTISSKLAPISKGLQTVGAKLTNSITKPALVAGSALTGVTLFKGWQRMTQIDNAKAKLAALGNSAKDVKAIMNNALASVKGTAYGMDEAATTAASAVVSGIKPGQQLQKYLTAVADTAAIAGTDMASMGSIFNKVAAKGKVDAEILNQLSDAGVPALSMLAKQLGVTTSEVSDMVSQGKVDFSTFQKAIESGTAGAAKAIGSATITGAIANIGASMSRIGANFLGTADDANSFAGQVLPLMNDLSGYLGKVEAKAAEWGAVFGQVFSAVIRYVRSGGESFGELSGAAQSIFSRLQPVLDVVMKLAKAFASLSPEMQGALIVGVVAAGPVVKAMGSLVGIVGSVSSAVGSMGTAFAVAAGKISRVPGALKSLPGLLKSAQVGFAGMAIPATGAAGKVNSIAMAAGGLTGKLKGGLSSGLSTLATGLAGAGTGAKVFLAAFGPIIAIVGTVAAAIAYLWKTNENFKNSIISCGQQIASAFQPVLQALGEMFAQIATTLAPVISQLITSLIPAIQSIITAITTVVSALAPALMAIIKAIMPVIQALGPIITTIATIVGTVISTIIQIITPIIEFVASVIAKVVQIITPIITFIASVISKVVTVITAIIGKVRSVFGTVKSVIVNIWNGIKAVISGVISGIVSVIRAITAPVRAVFGGIKTVIVTVFNAVKSAWGGLTDFVGGVFDGIASAFESLVSGVKKVINFVIKGINCAIGIINKIPGVEINKIGYLYHGTDDWQGGFAYMNEGGRGELTYLPNGARVIPHDVSMKYARESAKANAGRSGFDFAGQLIGALSAAGSSGTYTIEAPVVIDSREIARATAQFTQEELNKLQTRSNRKRGYR